MATVTSSTGQQVIIPSGTGDSASAGQTLANAISARLSSGSTLSTYNGSVPAAPANGTGVLLIPTSSTSTPITVPTGYTSLILNSGGPNTVTGNGGQNLLVVADNGGLNFNVGAAGGSGSVIAGDGNNTITTPTTGGGAYRIQTGAGNDSISALTGSNTVLAGAGSNFVNTGTGNNVVNSTGNDTFLGGTGTGGSDTIGVNASGTSSLVFGMNTRVTFVGGTGGTATVSGGTGTDTVFGNQGTIVAFGGTAGGNILVAGTQGATLVGGGNGDLLFASGVRGGPGQVLTAGTGNSTLFGGSSASNDTFFAGNNGTLNGFASQANTIIGLGSGNDTVFAGTGNATIISGTGADLFAFVNGKAGGTDLIGSFNAAKGDRVTLQGYGTNAVANAVAGQVTAGSGATASTTITLSDNTKITFTGVSSLSTTNFV